MKRRTLLHIMFVLLAISLIWSVSAAQAEVRYANTNERVISAVISYSGDLRNADNFQTVNYYHRRRSFHRPFRSYPYYSYRRYHYYPRRYYNDYYSPRRYYYGYPRYDYCY